PSPGQPAPTATVLLFTRKGSSPSASSKVLAAHPGRAHAAQAFHGIPAVSAIDREHGVYLSPSCPSRSRFNVGGLSRAVDTSSPQEIANHLGMKEGARHRSGAACTSGLLPLLGAIRNLVMTSPTWWVSRCAATRSRTRWRSPRLAAGIQRDGFAPQERKLKGPRIRRGP